jgi:hypothetical protein
MKRVAVALSILAVLGASPALAQPRPHLQAYVGKVGVQIGTYRTLLKRLNALLTGPPVTNVDPLVDKLNRVAGRLDQLAGRWQRIAAPHGLGLRHRGMGRAFVLIADALRIEAAAIFTRHPDEVAAAGRKAKARFLSAAYLQMRWTRALRGALVLAGLRVPHWLQQIVMATP